MDKHTETEVKLRVPDLALIAKRLEGIGATLKTPRVYERNIHYDDPAQTLTGSGRVLRLRQDNAARLTYKEPAALGAYGSTTRTEIEIGVDDFEAADMLLQRIGFTPTWVYEKYRTTYTLDGCEVVLDELPIGTFVEIEGEPEAIRRCLVALGLDRLPTIKESYSALFHKLKQDHNLPIRDLTFDNFRDIDSEKGLFPFTPDEKE
ncbi:MAG TPA: class IV adenylate cyclase [Aggregatilineales bacterium]|nr:class IV adenylate cyclase [Anaerolineales bacterium]HRE47179.1 class IV adenylate cyclase [Aggregatilineales bacterium]